MCQCGGVEFHSNCLQSKLSRMDSKWLNNRWGGGLNSKSPVSRFICAFTSSGGQQTSQVTAQCGESFWPLSRRQYVHPVSTNRQISRVLFNYKSSPRGRSIVLCLGIGHARSTSMFSVRSELCEASHSCSVRQRRVRGRWPTDDNELVSGRLRFKKQVSPHILSKKTRQDI